MPGLGRGQRARWQGSLADLSLALSKSFVDPYDIVYDGTEKPGDVVLDKRAFEAEAMRKWLTASHDLDP
eukprot:11209931-Lingulodinium_polyedra.AAC.1